MGAEQAATSVNRRRRTLGKPSGPGPGVSTEARPLQHEGASAFSAGPGKLGVNCHRSVKRWTQSDNQSNTSTPDATSATIISR
jgi:hypothetical protein